MGQKINFRMGKHLQIPFSFNAKRKKTLTLIHDDMVISTGSDVDYSMETILSADNTLILGYNQSIAPEISYEIAPRLTNELKLYSEKSMMIMGYDMMTIGYLDHFTVGRYVNYDIDPQVVVNAE